MAKNKTCKFCKESKPKEEMIVVNMTNFCNHSCAAKHGISLSKKTREKKQKADLKARKEALKPASKFLSEAQASFNKYIRIRDLYLGCISCGKSREEVESEQSWKVGGSWDAGHFMTRGAKGQLRFILFNVHKQCKKCNGGSDKFSHKAATVGEKYRKNLINKIGVEKVEFLENNNDLDANKKDIEYLKRVKAIFNKKYNLYKKKFR